MALRILISASVLLLFTATVPSALAGSATQPGDTMGSASGAEIPPGFYIANQLNWGCSDATPETCVLTDIPLFAWSTPWKILGARLAFATAPATGVDLDIDETYEETDWFNPFVGTTLNWGLGHGWGFTYLLGAYLDLDSPLAYSSTSLNQRFGFSYIANEWNLTANTIWGVQFDEATTDPQGYPCPTDPSRGCNPDFLNVDLTATKRFGKWEAGGIGFYATDVSRPIPDYRKQSKAAIGGLVGYWFGPVILQMYVTTELHEEYYGAKETRVWSRVVIPLGAPPARGARPLL